MKGKLFSIDLFQFHPSTLMTGFALEAVPSISVRGFFGSLRYGGTLGIPFHGDGFGSYVVVHPRAFQPNFSQTFFISPRDHDLIPLTRKKAGKLLANSTGSAGDIDFLRKNLISCNFFSHVRPKIADYFFSYTK